MFNRIGVVATSATLITVGTLAFSTVALIRSEPNLRASEVNYGHTDSPMFSLNDRSNLRLPASPDLNEPVALMCYMC